MIRTFYWLGFGLLIMYLIKKHYGFEWRTNLYDENNRFKYIPLLQLNVLGCLFLITATLWWFWIIAPFSFEVVRGSYFPQYIYADFVDLTYIVPVYVQNSMIFLVNTLTKLFHFLFIAYVFLPKFGDSKKWLI